MGDKKTSRSLVERIATSLKIIPDLDRGLGHGLDQAGGKSPTGLTRYPEPDQWDHWTEYDAGAWPQPVERDYMIVPTTCFNCESACGLLGYVDKETQQIRKFEGNPHHPGSRGRNCAKGPATINQIKDTDRILYPQKRVGKRGDGKWERVTWDQVLDDLAARLRKAIVEERNNEIAYHVGRPGHEGYMDRVLNAWNVDGHNSHTNVCSSAARLGYTLWHGFDRPSPDHANAKFILLVSAHLESGHYFNPHAQRIMEGILSGAKLAVMDPRLSNTASTADYWMPTQPGSEPAVLLAIARLLLLNGKYNREFLSTWVNWQDYLEKKHNETGAEFDRFIERLISDYQEFTPEFAEQESGVPAAMIIEVAEQVGEAGTQLATHTWRSASAGNLGGWCVARCLHFLNVLTGSVGTEGGTSPSGWNKFKPTFFDNPPAHKFWNELHFPNEYPLACYEMSILLPHFLKEGRGKMDTYFTRVFNPVWSYPDGFSWIDVLSDPELIECHIAMTPTWNETAYFADYVLPMGHSAERHDLNSYETHSGKWIAFRQPILREAARRRGEAVEFTYESNPGEVWEEDEFWIELSWRIDHDGSLGIRKHFLSPYRTDGEHKITIDEYYQFIFENTAGLPEAAAAEDLDPLAYMRKYGAFEVDETLYEVHLKPKQDGGIEVDGASVTGFNTPSKKQEIYSQTMSDWKWPEYAAPAYIKSHVHPENISKENSEYVLLPTFRLPTLIHSRSGNAKWLAEISNRNPLWVHTSDAEQLGIETGDLLRLSTEIGHFVDRAWVSEAIRPGIIACSHHLGRWRRDQDPLANRWAMNTVDISCEGGIWKLSHKKGTESYSSNDPDSERIFWADGGVHQNLIFPVQPDPISGMQCWHQKVKAEAARPEDSYGDVVVDSNKSMEVYRRWLSQTRPAPGPDNLRRPLWFKRPLRPVEERFYLK